MTGSLYKPEKTAINVASEHDKKQYSFHFVNVGVLTGGWDAPPYILYIIIMYMDITKASVCVGTYANHNAGILDGEWIAIADYETKQDFIEACRKIHGEHEFMFQDYNNIPDGVCTESTIPESLFGVVQEAKGMDDDRREALYDYLGLKPWIIGHGTEDIINAFEEDYMGVFDDEKDFAVYMADMTMDIPERLIMYFDYDALARDMFLTDYSFVNGRVYSRL